MSQQSMRQAARRSALDAQAALRKERADRERRREALAVAVLTALGEGDALVRDAERRAGQALRTITEDEGLSLREAVEWCGSGALTVREVTRLRQLAHDPPGGSADERPTHAPPGHSNSDQSGHPGRRCGRGALRPAGRTWEDDAFTCRAARGYRSGGR
jgi:hypothetical protein